MTSQLGLTIEAARELGSMGIPVFRARVNELYEPTVTDPKDPRHGEHKLPGGWSRLPAKPARFSLAAGPAAFCLVTGHGIDAVDVDTKHGADVDEHRQALTTLGITILAEVRTPSGGAHFYVPSTGFRSTADTKTGVDYRGGDEGGNGRGFLYLPGSARPKYGNRGYKWVSKPLGTTTMLLLRELDLEAERDAMTVYRERYGIGTTAGTPAAVVQATSSPVEPRTPRLRDKLADLSPEAARDRSARFHHLVAEARRAGHEQAETVALLEPWCAATGKFVGRVAEEVARCWGKVVVDPMPTLTPTVYVPLNTPDPDPHHSEETEQDSETTVTTDATSQTPAEGHRSLNLTPASQIKVRPVRWLWTGRVALGSLVLLGGREGIGKSTVSYQLAADITRGRLRGQYEDQPKSVIVAATEDSWEHTIVPRLMAAGADLERIYRVEVTTSLGFGAALSLPRDLAALEQAVGEVDAALILLDPLMSRLDGALDSHKDQEVRQALEPLVALADRSGAAVLGLIHVNKSHSTDPLSLLMGSRAFAAVARAVLFVMVDPEDESARLLGQPKNNLGRTDLPTLTFGIESAHVADTDEGPVWTGRVRWTGETDRSLSDALEASGEAAETRTATSEAADWLRDHLMSQGGTDDSASIKAAGAKAGHSLMTLKRARTRIKAEVESHGFPRRTFWTLPGTLPEQSDQPPAQSDQHSQTIPGESGPTGLTGPTEPTGTQLDQLDQSDRPPETCSDCGFPVDQLGHEGCLERAS